MREGRHHAGIIMAPQRRFGVGELVRRLTRLATALEPDEMADRLEFLNDWR